MRRVYSMTAPALLALVLLGIPASALAETGDPSLVLRWLPAAPTGEEQAALPEVPEAPGAPVE